MIKRLQRQLEFADLNAGFANTPPARDVVAKVDLTGRLAVVTGASGGIGLPTADALLSAGADVIIVTRPGEKADKALAQLTLEAGGRVSALPADLMSLVDVEAVADSIISRGRPVDILIHNAGVMGPLRHNELGIESQLMTHVVSPAVLTSKLAGTFRPGTRVIFVSSFGHQFAPVDFDDLNFERRPYSPWVGYGQSKTGAILIAGKVGDALGSRGIDAFALHPGAIMTDMPRHMTEADYAEMEKFGGVPEHFISVEQGAATQVWAATAPELQGKGGLYLENCAVAPLVENASSYGVLPRALDQVAGEQLWHEVERLISRRLPL